MKEIKTWVWFELIITTIGLIGLILFIDDTTETANMSFNYFIKTIYGQIYILIGIVLLMRIYFMARVVGLIKNGLKNWIDDTKRMMN